MFAIFRYATAEMSIATAYKNKMTRSPDILMPVDMATFMTRSGLRPRELTHGFALEFTRIPPSEDIAHLGKFQMCVSTYNHGKRRRRQGGLRCFTKCPARRLAAMVIVLIGIAPRR